ncbi:MAG: PD40 domain-containing protein [Calditrichaceae bacterium]|nr:PD40 domain-containing protein [Calditrichaceae bacterium]RQV97660.1 MAG: DUF5050 domain-containing protein [Calditrichota bacterium]
MIKTCTFFSLIVFLSLFLACSGSKTSTADEPTLSFADTELQAKVEELKEKIDDNPGNLLYRRQFAELYYQNGESLEALRVLERATIVDPGDAETKYMYAEVAESLGDLPKAYQAYKDVLQGADGDQYLSRVSSKFSDAFVVEKVIGTSANEAFGSFSADGNKIVYQSDQSGNWDIFEYDLVSQTTNQITFNPSHEENPHYSPDGKSVVYASTFEDRRDVDYDQKLRDIFLYDMINKKEWNLTTNGSNDWRPRYSPDGMFIAFASERDDLRDVPFYELYSNIYFMENDGRFQMALTKDESNNGSPCIAPGTTEFNGYVYFDSDRTRDYEIYRINIRGEELMQITFNPSSNDVSPSISPLGDKLVFFSDRDGNYEIYMMNTDGSAQQRLTSNPADDCNPGFSPDGNKVIFHANRTGNYDIYVLDLTKQTGTLQLTEVIAKIDEAMQGTQQ